MTLATSTLGCLEWDLPTLIARLRSYGYDAVDFRGLRGSLKLWELPEFSGQRQHSAAQLRDAGLAVSAFSASARLVWQSEAEREKAREELRRTAELCQVFGSRMIRVFGGGLGDLDRARARERAQAELAVWVTITAPAGVQLAVETHDAWTASDELLGLIADTDPRQVGVVWNLKHPYWAARETPVTTWDKLKERIANTHWKDTRRDPVTGQDRLCLCGEGLLPLADVSALLAAAGYAGYYTLEWERQWHPYLVGPEVAFPHFVQFMRRLQPP